MRVQTVHIALLTLIHVVVEVTGRVEVRTSVASCNYLVRSFRVIWSLLGITLPGVQGSGVAAGPHGDDCEGRGSGSAAAAVTRHKRCAAIGTAQRTAGCLCLCPPAVTRPCRRQSCPPPSAGEPPFIFTVCMQTWMSDHLWTAIRSFRLCSSCVTMWRPTSQWC